MPRPRSAGFRTGQPSRLAVVAGLLLSAWPVLATGTLRVLPESIELHGAADTHGLLVNLTAVEHTEDVTRQARFSSAEVMADAVSAATGVPDRFEGFPLGLRAVQLPEPTTTSYFLSLFGRSERVTACACERSGSVTLPQLLHLQNGEEMTKKVRSRDGRLSELLKHDPATAEVIEELYLTALNRRPTAAETKRLLTTLGQAKPEEALPDLFWALLNTKEFAFNH